MLGDRIMGAFFGPPCCSLIGLLPNSVLVQANEQPQTTACSKRTIHTRVGILSFVIVFASSVIIFERFPMWLSLVLEVYLTP